MQHVRLVTLFAFSLSLLIAPLAQSAEDPPLTEASKTVQQLIDWETTANAAALRSNKPFPVEHFEIPLKEIGHSFSESLDPKIRESIVFQKNGEDYVRWLINPEDSKWYKQVEEWLKLRNLDVTRYKFFTAYLTASRSMILVNPKTKYSFSAKVSTDKTGGLWKDKHLPVDDAEQVRMADDLVLEKVPLSTPVQGGGRLPISNRPKEIMKLQERIGAVKFDFFDILPEPAELEIEQIDQAMLIRSLGNLNEGKKHYLPGFSALHDKIGREIALKNGSTNPAQFWDEHYNRALARAYAEFTAHYGLTYDSPHSQNFLIELDENFKPTGKIIFRDFGDTYAFRPFFEAVGETEFLKRWEIDNINAYLNVSVGVLHGNDYPTWINDKIYDEWGRNFYQTFDDTFSEITGIPRTSFSKGGHYRSGRYFSKTYQNQKGFFDSYFDLAPCFHGHSVTKSGNKCPDRLMRKIVFDDIRCKKNLQPPQ